MHQHILTRTETVNHRQDHVMQICFGFLGQNTIDCMVVSTLKNVPFFFQIGIIPMNNISPETHPLDKVEPGRKKHELQHLKSSNFHLCYWKFGHGFGSSVVFSPLFSISRSAKGQSDFQVDPWQYPKEKNLSRQCLASQGIHLSRSSTYFQLIPSASTAAPI